MRRISTTFFLLLVFSFNHLRGIHSELIDYSQEQGKPATIKVLIEEQVEGTLIEVKGSFKVYNPQNGKALSSGSRGKRYFLYPHPDGIKWGEVYPGIFQIRIIPTSPQTTILVGGIEYKGALECYHVDNHISIVNEVDIENYIKATLTSSVASNIPGNVMDSIAIVARTNAYYIYSKNRDSYWHIEAKKVGYGGYASTLLHTNVDRAVDATRFLIMTYEGKPFPSTWTENCAGKTATYQAIFRKSVRTPEGIESPFATEIRKDSKWTFSIPKEKLAKIAKTNRVTGVDLFIDPPSEKIYAMRIKDGVHFQDIDFLNLQEILGKDFLKSSDFNVFLKDDKVVFEGYGKGPGVGLCIYSATCIAEKGETVPHIIGTFFPLTRLVYMRNIYENAVLNEQNDF